MRTIIKLIVFSIIAVLLTFVWAQPEVKTFIAGLPAGVQPAIVPAALVFLGLFGGWFFRRSKMDQIMEKLAALEQNQINLETAVANQGGTSSVTAAVGRLLDTMVASVRGATASMLEEVGEIRNEIADMLPKQAPDLDALLGELVSRAQTVQGFDPAVTEKVQALSAFANAWRGFNPGDAQAAVSPAVLREWVELGRELGQIDPSAMPTKEHLSALAAKFDAIMQVWPAREPVEPLDLDERMEEVKEALRDYGERNDMPDDSETLIAALQRKLGGQAWYSESQTRSEKRDLRDQLFDVMDESDVWSSDDDDDKRDMAMDVIEDFVLCDFNVPETAKAA